jgi:hypothetical protein
MTNYYAIFYDKEKKELLGSDSYIYIDGRMNTHSAMMEALKHKESYKRHFPHKYKSMAYVRFGKGSRLGNISFTTGYIAI